MRSPRTTAKSSPCSLQLEKARVQQQRPNTAKKEDVSCGNAWNSIYLFIYLFRLRSFAFNTLDFLDFPALACAI